MLDAGAAASSTWVTSGYLDPASGFGAWPQAEGLIDALSVH